MDAGFCKGGWYQSTTNKTWSLICPAAFPKCAVVKGCWIGTLNTANSHHATKYNVEELCYGITTLKLCIICWQNTTLCIAWKWSANKTFVTNMFVGQKGGGGWQEGWLATQATSPGSTPDHGFKIWRSY